MPEDTTLKVIADYHDYITSMEAVRDCLHTIANHPEAFTIEDMRDALVMGAEMININIQGSRLLVDATPDVLEKTKNLIASLNN